MAPGEALQHNKGFAPVFGTRLYYEISGEGHPLVLLHAGIADSRMWDAQFAEFAGHYRVLRYDLRGHGQSPVVQAAYSHWQDLLELMDYLEIEQAHLLGASLGGRAALEFALERPERAGALVLVSTSPSGYPQDDPPEFIEEAGRAAQAGDFVTASEYEVRAWVDGPHRGPDEVNPQLRDAVREMNIANLKYEATGLGAPAAADPPAAERLENVVAPALVIYGELDQEHVIAGSRALAERIPAARWAAVPGAAHLLNMESPEEFNRLVLDFLKEY